MTRRPRTLLAMSPTVRACLLDAGTLARLERIARCDPDLLVTDFADPALADRLAGTEVLLSCWGCPPLTGEALARMPALRTVVHAAGSVRSHVTDACWRRGLTVSSAASANAVPVAEFTLAAILFAGKQVWRSARGYADRRDVPPGGLAHYAGVGNHRRVVGVVGASRIGRLVIERLRPFGFTVLVNDPHLDAAGAAALGARPAGLDELAAGSDVVTLHAPQLPGTRHLFDRRRLGLMRDGATLVNTARGSLVDTDALTAELVAGRLNAVLDHTDPEVPPADSPLYDLPNVLLTPHIAGSLGNELPRLADAALDELARYAAGLPYAEPVTREAMDRSA